MLARSNPAAGPNFDPDYDPKVIWAVRHPEQFPMEINTAPYKQLLRVPGNRLGLKNRKQISCGVCGRFGKKCLVRQHLHLRCLMPIKIKISMIFAAKRTISQTYSANHSTFPLRKIRHNASSHLYSKPCRAPPPAVFARQVPRKN